MRNCSARRRLIVFATACLAFLYTAVSPHAQYDGGEPAQRNDEQRKNNQAIGDPTINPSGLISMWMQLQSIAMQSQSNGDKRQADQAEGGSKQKRWYDIFIDRATDWLLVLFNGILAVFTALLYRATSGLWAAAKEQSGDMKKSIAVSDKSAEAALKSALVAEQTLYGTEAPFLFIIIASTDGNDIVTVTSPQGVEYPEHVSYMFHNYGRSQAIIREIYLACIASDVIPSPCSFPHCKLSFFKLR
jgi:hypothetical protein